MPAASDSSTDRGGGDFFVGWHSLALRDANDRGVAEALVETSEVGRL